MRTQDKEFRRLIRAARAAGWRIDESGKRYIKCWSTNGKTMIVVPTSPSSGRRGYQNKRAEFRRAGLSV